MISVTIDGASRQRTVTQKLHRCGKCDDCDGPDDEMQRFSKGVGQLICVTTPPDYRGGHESFYLSPWQRRAERWNFSGRAWGTASALKVNTEDATPARIE